MLSDDEIRIARVGSEVSIFEVKGGRGRVEDEEKKADSMNLLAAR